MGSCFDFLMIFFADRMKYLYDNGDDDQNKERKEEEEEVQQIM